jgi:hypothetical protein
MCSTDIVIYHFTNPKLNDLFKYLNGNKNINLYLNITGASDQHVEILSDLLERNSIKCPFFISNLHEKIHLTKSKRKVFNLLPAADIFFTEGKTLDYNLDAAIVSDSPQLSKEVEKDFQCYHKIGLGQENEYYDFTTSIMNMNNLYSKYKKIILATNINTAFSQIFFDAVYKAKKVALKTNDTKKSNEVLADLFKSETEEDDVESFVKNQIKTKHNCFNRAARLAQAFKFENASKVLQDLGNKI